MTDTANSIQEHLDRLFVLVRPLYQEWPTAGFMLVSDASRFIEREMDPVEVIVIPADHEPRSGFFHPDHLYENNTNRLGLRRLKAKALRDHGGGL